MVGRLVDEQEIGVLHQQLRQLEPPFLTAAQLRRMPLLRLGVDAEPAERLACVRLQLVAALVDVAMLHVAIALQQLRGVGPCAVGEQRLERGHLLVHRGEVLARCHHLVEDRLGDRLRSVLRQVADAQPALPFDLAGGRLSGAADQRQQRRLAGAVGADDGDAITRLDAERDALEHALCTEGDTRRREG